MFNKVSEIPGVGRHALDAPAMPPRKLGAQGSIEETLWMRMWRDLVPDLNALNGALNGKALDLEGMSRLAAAVRPGEGEPLEQLESFVQGLLRPLAEDALGRLLPEDHGLHAVLGWRLYLTREGSLDEAVKALETTEPAVYTALEATKKTAAQELTSRMWRLGNPGSLIVRAVPELRLIALSFLDALDEIESELVRCPLVPDAGVREMLLGQLPLKMALELDSRPAGEGPSPSKTDFAPIITEAQARAFPRIPQVIEAKESMLVLGPTGCGKSRVGHVAAAHTVYAARRRHEEARALILVPTKTMVRESHQRWLEWTKADDASWRVVAGSADDREYDEALAHGEYDVGICVYEKLASLVYSGSDVLNRVGLIVVDEFQNLAQGQRGVSLEALLTILRMGPYPIPIVALSASLTNESTKTARRWLDVKHMVEVSSRPTELRFSLVDGVTRRTRVVPAATTGSEESGPPVHVDEPSVPHQIGPIPDVWPHSLRQRISDIRVTLPILQICQLLDSDEVADRRILCFVRDRDRAREVATLLRECLDLQHPMGRLPRQPNPWKLGRYAADLDLSDAARRDRYEQFLWTEDNYWRQEVQRGFLSGVTYHTRTLQMPLRHRIEDEFDTGLVRVLVCTDTLAEGVNLSASDVVVADLTQRSRGAEEPISVGKLKNRAGRAGRLGKSQPQGTAYIVIDPRFPTRLLGSPEDAPRLSELDSAWRHWIEQEAPEEALGSALADSSDGHDNLCGLVLRALAVDNRFRTREELVERIDEVISNTLWAAWGGHVEAERIIDELEERDLVDTEPGGGDVAVAPDGDAVVERLLEAQVVAEVAEQPDQLQVTKLGMAVARSALPLNSANHILRVAGGGTAGVGDLSLLHLSAQDPSVKSTLARKWLAWKRPYDQNPEQRDHVIKQVQLYAATYGHPQHRVRKAVAERKWRLPLPAERGEVEWYEPDPALVDRDPRPMPPVLERWICDTNLVEDGAQGTYASEKEFAVSVLRAVVAYEWANLQPFKEMKLRLDSITTPRRKIRRKMREPDPAIPFSVTDLEQLGERVGYVLGAASELLEDNPVARERLSVLSDECAHGVPLWLIPLARLNLDGLGREPLIGIHRKGVKQVDDLAELLRRDDLGIPDRVRKRALKRYEEIRARSQDSYVQLPADLENVSMASAEGQPYADVWRNLMDGDRADSRELKTAFSELLAGHQIPAVVSVESGMVVAEVGSGPDQLDLVVINGNLNRTKLNALRRRSRPCVAVPLRLPQPGIIWELNRPGSVTRGIQPRALMILLYGLRQDHREDLEGKFVECFADYPAGFAGIGVVRRMLERLRIEAPVQLEDFVKEFEE
jgi:superfamily II DNA/RNA helicase